MRSDPVQSQIKQRAAVRAAKRHALIRVGSSTFGRRRKLHLVYVHGEPFIADDGELLSLREGLTPAELKLSQPEDENEPFAGFH